MNRFKKKISSNKSLIESFFSLSILNGLNVILPLVTIPYILRVVGVANYGVYSYVYVLIQYLLLFNQFGFNYSATKQIAQHRNNMLFINRIYSSVLIFRFLLLIAGVIVLIILSPLLLDTKEIRIMFLMGLGVVIGDILNPIWLFQGLEKMRYITYANLFSKVLFTVLIFVLIRKIDDYKYIILYNSLGYILGGIVSTIIAVKIFSIKFTIITWKDIKHQYNEGITLFGSTISINLYRNANILLLKFFVSDEALGIYAVAEKVIKGFQLLINPISQALFPHFGHTFQKQSIYKSLTQLKKIVSKLSILFFTISLSLILFTEPIITIITGKNIYNAVFITRIMSLIIFLGGINYLLGFVGLVNLDRQKSFFYLVLISGVISVLFVIATVSTLGITAAALGMVISEIVLLIGGVSVLRKLSNQK